MTQIYVPCSVCGGLVEPDKTHNARPLNDGRCCEGCNTNFVVPERNVRETTPPKWEC